jgi:hypothetical protein
LTWPGRRFSCGTIFFLSFTSRYPSPELGGPNPINVAYKHFIKHVLGEDAITSSNQRGTNLLAKAICLRLTTPGIEGYYYPRQQYDNAETEKKLEEACDESFMFVQLIQSILFYPPARGKNFCFLEWDRVMRRLSADEKEERILYVLAEMDYRELQDLTPPPPDEYNGWYQHVSKKDRPHLPKVPFWRQAILEDLEEKIADHLLTRIKDAWIELSIGVPN